MANKRELNISEKKLYHSTREDIILKSPFRIPPKGLQDLQRLKGLKIVDYAYYDIAKTEIQAINYRDRDHGVLFDHQLIEAGYTSEETNVTMGEFNDI
jgi:hypothetical protein